MMLTLSYLIQNQYTHHYCSKTCQAVHDIYANSNSFLSLPHHLVQDLCNLHHLIFSIFVIQEEVDHWLSSLCRHLKTYFMRIMTSLSWFLKKIIIKLKTNREDFYSLRELFTRLYISHLSKDPDQIILLLVNPSKTFSVFKT